MDLKYITGGKTKRYYSIKRQQNKGEIFGKVTRISCKEYDNPKTNPTLGYIKPKVGDKVMIIIKPYKKYICHTGIVQKVLTNKNIHTRGHKVKLVNNIVGRTLKIIK